MDTCKKVDENIETYYERNNLDIPNVEKELYFDNAYGPKLDIKNTADESVKKKYQLYKGFLASEKIKEQNGMRVHQVIPENVDPRNMRFVRSNIPMCEQQDKRRNDQITMHYQPDISEKSEVSNSEYDSYSERSKLLADHNEQSELKYPLLDDERESELARMPYDPIKLTDEASADKPSYVTQERDTNRPVEDMEDVKMTNRPPPSKQNFTIHQVKPNDTIEKLCIQYNVNKDVIRMANDFLGEEIYMFKTLKIPYTYGKMYQSFSSPEDDEKLKRQFAVDALAGIIMSTQNKKEK